MKQLSLPRRSFLIRLLVAVLYFLFSWHFFFSMFVQTVGPAYLMKASYEKVEGAAAAADCSDVEGLGIDVGCTSSCGVSLDAFSDTEPDYLGFPVITNEYDYINVQNLCLPEITDTNKHIAV